MNKKTGLRNFKSSLELPDDVRKRFFEPYPDYDTLTKLYPGKTMYSYRAIAGLIWFFIAQEFKLTCLPPPVIVDKRPARKCPRMYTEDGKLYSWVVGCHNYCCEVVHEDNEAVGLIPMDYEVRIFHQNVLEEIRSMFGNKPVGDAGLIPVYHVIFHEYCHFLRLLWAYQKELDYIGDKEKLGEAIKDMKAHLKLCGNPEDEYETEKMTLKLLARYFFDTDYDYQNLGDLIIGGPYDLWRRTKSYTWALFSTYLEYNQLCNEIDYGHISKEEIERMENEKGQILSYWESCMKSNRNEYTPYVLL